MFVCQLHSWARDGFREDVFQPDFAVGGEFGEEVGQGGPEVFGDDGGLGVVVRIGTRRFWRGLGGFRSASVGL